MHNKNILCVFKNTLHIHFLVTTVSSHQGVLGFIILFQFTVYFCSALHFCRNLMDPFTSAPLTSHWSRYLENIYEGSKFI